MRNELSVLYYLPMLSMYLLYTLFMYICLSSAQTAASIAHIAYTSRFDRTTCECDPHSGLT